MGEFPSFIFYFFKFIYFIYFWLRWVFIAARAFSSCGERGLLFVAVRGLLIAVASVVAEHGLYGTRASVVVARRLSSCGSWTLERRLSSRGVRA